VKKKVCGPVTESVGNFSVFTVAQEEYIRICGPNLVGRIIRGPLSTNVTALYEEQPKLALRDAAIVHQYRF
jgi:hypothetical protein